MPIDEREGEESVEKPARKRRRADLDTRLDLDASDLKGGIRQSLELPKLGRGRGKSQAKAVLAVRAQMRANKAKDQATTQSALKLDIDSELIQTGIGIEKEESISVDPALYSMLVHMFSDATEQEEFNRRLDILNVLNSAYAELDPAARHELFNAVTAAIDEIKARSRLPSIAGDEKRAANSATTPAAATTRVNAAGTDDALADFLGREQYGLRARRSETPEAFILRVYGEPTELGLSQADFRRLDPKLYQALMTMRSRRGLTISLPTRDDPIRSKSPEERLQELRRRGADAKRRYRARVQSP